jgi:hypothetical protein
MALAYVHCCSLTSLANLLGPQAISRQCRPEKDLETNKWHKAGPRLEQTLGLRKDRISEGEVGWADLRHCVVLPRRGIRLLISFSFPLFDVLCFLNVSLSFSL